MLLCPDKRIPSSPMVSERGKVRLTNPSDRRFGPVFSEEFDKRRGQKKIKQKKKKKRIAASNTTNRFVAEAAATAAEKGKRNRKKVDDAQLPTDAVASSWPRRQKGQKKNNRHFHPREPIREKRRKGCVSAEAEKIKLVHSNLPVATEGRTAYTFVVLSGATPLAPADSPPMPVHRPCRM